ncbi:hypothetical protein HPP92_010717 [Vanilla planifolia]|uniref:Uncharacterized protein n=1 Tax=Vanilla planifolia TaxID=51239 RepID=A0A835UXT9_VANPL|nr:hypothetical protein HPP92_010717 [Vanilla planifolia]
MMRQNDKKIVVAILCEEEPNPPTMVDHYMHVEAHAATFRQAQVHMQEGTAPQTPARTRGVQSSKTAHMDYMFMSNRKPTKPTKSMHVCKPICTQEQHLRTGTVPKSEHPCTCSNSRA